MGERRDLYPDLDFDAIRKRAAELRACETDSEAIRMVLANRSGKTVVGVADAKPQDG